MNQSFAKAGVTLYNLLHIYSTFYVLGQSHKKWKDSPETRGVLIEISKLCWSLPRVPKQQGLLQKKYAICWRDKLFAGDLRVNLVEKNADMVQITKRWNWKWIV